MLQVKNLKPVNKGTLVCKFDLVITNLGLTIRECTYFEKGTQHWISMPQKQYEKDNKKCFYAYVYWEKERMEALQRKVTPLIQEALTDLAYKND